MIGIIGGGITGLSIAHHLKEKAVVLEALPQTGGLCRTITDGGFTFDFGGSHIIFSKDQEVLDFMLGVLEDNRVKNKRNTKILYKGRKIKYPFENGLSDLPILENIECLVSFMVNYIMGRVGLIPKPTNFKECLYAVFGKGIADKYLIPYNEKIWNIKTEQMDCGWVKDRLPQPEPLSLLKASLGIGSEGYTHQLFFYYPKNGGIQALVDSIKKRTRARILPNYQVKSIKKIKEGFEVSDGETPMRFETLVSTMALPDLIHAIKDPVPVQVKQAAGNLRFNSLISVLVGLDAPVLNDISWMYIPKEVDGLFNRISFPFNFSTHTTPEGKTSVLCEITHKEGDDTSKMKDDGIIKQVIEKLHTNRIINKGQVCYTNIKRHKYAYVVYDKDHAKNKEIAKRFVEDYGIHLCGRFSEFEYYNMDKCIRRAMEMAKTINKK